MRDSYEPKLVEQRASAVDTAVQGFNTVQVQPAPVVTPHPQTPGLFTRLFASLIFLFQGSGEQPAAVNKSKNEQQDGQRRRRESGQRDDRRRSNEPPSRKPKETTADKSDAEERQARMKRNRPTAVLALNASPEPSVLHKVSDVPANASRSLRLRPLSTTSWNSTKKSRKLLSVANAGICASVFGVQSTKQLSRLNPRWTM